MMCHFQFQTLTFIVEEAGFLGRVSNSLTNRKVVNLKLRSLLTTLVTLKVTPTPH